MALSVSPYGLPAPPLGGAKETSANSPWCIPNGILRTAGNPSGAMRPPQLCIKQLYAIL